MYALKFCKDNELIKSSDTVSHPVGQITRGEAQCQMARLLPTTELPQLSLAFFWTTKPCIAKHALKFHRSYVNLAEDNCSWRLIRNPVDSRIDFTFPLRVQQSWNLF